MALWNRMLLISLVIVVLGSTGLGLPAAARQRLDEPALDLSAMILTPIDLGNAGMAAYPIDQVWGELQSPFATADDFFASQEVPADRARAVFVESDLQRAYRHVYVLKYPNDPVPAVYTARRVATSIFEFADDAAATVAFTPLAEMLGRDSPAIAPASGPLGDESRLASDTAPDLDVNAEISLTFRTGRLIASVAVRDDVGQPEQTAVETLAASLLERMRAVADAGGPDLGRFALRFRAGALVPGPFEGYTLLGGNVVVRSANAADVDRPIQATAAAGAGALDGYGLAAVLLDESGEFGAAMASAVYRFPDTDSAAAWFHALPSRLATTSARDLSVSAEPGVGDEAFSATFQSDPSETIRYRRADAVRVGPLVAIHSGTEMTWTAARQLLIAQAACLSSGGCTVLLPVPDGVIGWSPED